MGITSNSDWELRSIGSLTDVFAGGTPSTQVDSYWGGEIRWMNSGELNLRKVYEVENRITEEGLKNSSARLIPKNCVLIGLAGQGKTRGTVAINRVELTTNQSVAAIYPSKEFITEYLYHNLDLRYNEIRDMSDGGGGRGGLNLKLIKSIEVPLPRLEEQKAIAKALTDIDDLIEILLLEKNKVEDIRISTLQEIFIKKRFGIANLVVESVVLGEVISEINDGGTPNTAVTDYFGGQINWAVVDDVVDEIYSTKSTLTEFGLQNSSAILWPAGTLILTTGATIGKVGIAMVPTATKQGLCGIRFDLAKVNTKYMKYWLQMNIDLLKSLSQGSTIKEVRPPELKKVKVELPNLTNQNQIVHVISDFDLEIAYLDSEINKYESIKQGMAHDLLTGKVRLV
jgi:type I restriction enzyme S subunit